MKVLKLKEILSHKIRIFGIEIYSSFIYFKSLKKLIIHRPNTTTYRIKKNINTNKIGCGFEQGKLRPTFINLTSLDK